ncbi:MAG: M1 family aminopeptidase [Gemmatimonadota bacterium]
MLRDVIRFEWRYHTRQIAFPVAVLFFLGMGYLLPAIGYGPTGANLNSPFVVMQSVGLLSLLMIFVLTVFCTNAVSRDAESGMQEIVFATPVGKLRYLTARFAGALLASLATFSACIVGLFVSPMVARMDPARVGATIPVAYLWALLVMAVPNILVAAAVIFAVAILSRSVLASYVGSVFLYMLYMVVGMMIGSPLFAGAKPLGQAALVRAAILDPFGISAFFQQTWYWTPAQRNSELLALSGYFLLNRVVVLVVALGILTVTYQRFSFRVAAHSVKRMLDLTDAAPSHTTAYQRVVVAAPSWRSHWTALRVATEREFRATATSKPFLALMALWVCVALIDITDNTVWEYHTLAYPTTRMMLADIQTTLPVLGALMLVYFAAEVVWRERIVRADEIIDATPTPSGVFYLAKGSALVLLTWLMTILPIVLAIGYQLATGYTNVHPLAYLSLFYFVGLPLVLLTVVIVLVQTLTPNRWLGVLLAMILALAILSPDELGLRHGMLRFAKPPVAPYTEMNGFVGAGSFAWYMVFWFSLAGLLAAVTLGIWRRGRAQSLLTRIRALPHRLGKAGLIGAAGSLALFAATGGIIFHDTNIAHRFETESQSLAWRASYERSYRRFDSMPLPAIVAAKATVNLYPSERRYAITGSYSLENRTTKAIDTVIVSQPRDVPASLLELTGARVVRHDDVSDTYIFALEQPMAPGARSELRFSVRSPQRHVVADGFDYDVVANGSYVTRAAAFPRLGYVRGYEVDDASERRARGLAPPRVGPGPIEDALAGRDRHESWMTLDATIVTDEDQTALAPGDLVREWKDNGRHYFHFVTPKPTTPVFGFVSARYAVRRVTHAGVNVEVHYDPAHAYNVDRMIAAATRTLDVLGSKFGPYPSSSLRIVELPAHWGFGAYAMPGVIVWPEDRGFVTRYREGDVDLVTKRLAHEVSHQWWGHTLYPAQVEGGVTLVETMAKYSELLVMEAIQGKASLPAMLRYERELYVMSRANMPFPEPTLLRAYDYDFVYYAKGAIVMEALRDLIGEEALNRALRTLLEEHGGEGKRPATTLDVEAALHAVSTPEQQQLIDEWFGKVTLYDLRIESASMEARPENQSRVTLTIRARKSLEPGGGIKPSEAALDELIDVAVYAENPLSSTAPALWSGKYRLRTGENRITIDVRGTPAFVSVDPFERRIEVERADNVREVTRRQ